MPKSGVTASVQLLDRLAVRLGILLTFALLPLGILAVVTSLDSRRTDIRSAERALISLTAEHEAGRRALIESALTTASALSQPTLGQLDDIAACRSMMADTVDRAGIFSFVGFTETNGLMQCVSQGDTQDFAESAIFRRVIDEPRALVRRSESGSTSGQPVLIATQPVFDNQTLRGFLSVVISLESFSWLRWNRQEEDKMQPILFNRLGEVISTSGPAEAADLLPVDTALVDLARSGGRVFKGRTVAGDRAVFALSELVEGQLYVLGVWPPDEGAAAALGAGRWPLLFPLVMWLASIGVVYFALDYLVIRHLRNLGRQMRRFALGDRALQPVPPSSIPQELREVHSIFQKMALLVSRDEAELSTALAEKEEILRERTVLLKEVHHRVKNNLQLIASILNLQMRRLQDPRTRRVLQNVQDRVIGLATIHRNLYQSEHLSELRVDQLIEELLRHLFAVGTETGGGVDLKTDLAPISLSPDQLVPLSLLLTEAVTNALKYGGTSGHEDRAWLRVNLTVDGEMLTLSVINSLGQRTASQIEEDELSSTGLGGELITAFAMQLGATLEQGRIDDADTPQWELKLVFKLENDDTADNSADTVPDASVAPA